MAIACALTKANELGIIQCKQPIYSAQLYFGIIRNIEWRILMGIQFKKMIKKRANTSNIALIASWKAIKKV